MRRRTLKETLLLAGGALGLLLLIAAWIWRADIHQNFLDPGVPYQLYKPLPAPDYEAPGSWALIPRTPTTWGLQDAPADVFFIHPTTYNGGRHWNAPLGVAAADKLLTTVMLPNYAGGFAKAGRIFAPHYRQANLYAHLTVREDGREARAFAYNDVATAFRLYMAKYNRGRPLIIVGVEQGGFIAQRLVRDEAAQNPALMKRLVGVYLIGVAVPSDFAAVPPCTAKDQAGCFVGYLAHAQGEPNRIEEQLRHAVVWRGDQAELFQGSQPVCINPVTGTRDGVSDERQHLGGVNASGLELDTRPAFLAHQVSARCENGILQLSKPRSGALRRLRNWMEVERARPFNIFYADLEADALGRLNAWMRTTGRGPLAPPLEGATEVGKAYPKL